MEAKIGMIAGAIGGSVTHELLGGFGESLLIAAACATVGYVTTQGLKYLHEKFKKK